MKVPCATILLIGIAAALSDASRAKEASQREASQLQKRTSCSTAGESTGVCVDTNDANPCSHGVGFLVTGLCPGSNSEICCFGSNACACTSTDCVCSSP